VHGVRLRNPAAESLPTRTLAVLTVIPTFGRRFLISVPVGTSVILELAWSERRDLTDLGRIRRRFRIGEYSKKTSGRSIILFQFLNSMGVVCTPEAVRYEKKTPSRSIVSQCGHSSLFRPFPLASSEAGMLKSFRQGLRDQRGIVHRHSILIGISYQHSRTPTPARVDMARLNGSPLTGHVQCHQGESAGDSR